MNPLRLNFRIRAVCCSVSLARALTLGRPRFREVLDCARPLALLERKVRSKAAEDCRSPRRWRADLITRSCFRAGLGILAALAFGLATAQAAVTEAWVHRYSNVVSNSDDQAVKVVCDAAGDIIVTGTTMGGIPRRDMLTIKYSGANGTMLWQKRYNGPANGDDIAKAVAVDSSGNVIVTGTTAGDNNSDFYTAKYAAADGELLWERRYDGPHSWNDYVNAVAVDSIGDVVVTGSSEGDYYTAKYAASDGVLLWEQHYNGPANRDDTATAVAVDRSGDVVVTGYSIRAGPDYIFDFYTAKYASVDGALLWEKRSDGPHDIARSVVLDRDGNAVVHGSSENASYTAKYAAVDGALLWEQHRTNTDFYEADYDQILAVDLNENVIVIGRHFDDEGGTGYFVAKYEASDGALIWEKHRHAITRSGFTPWAIQSVAVDGSGNVIVAASSGSFLFSSHYDTAKFGAADGTLLWEKQYDAPTNSYDFAQAIAVDSSGNVAVTGISRRNDINHSHDDYLTLKYAAADGALLWGKRYDGSAIHYARAYAIAVDNSGNVAVTGHAYNNFNGDCYTAKYAASGGTLLWEKHFNGFGQALALDGSGNVVVTGFSRNGTDHGCYTAKYAAADGVLLWERWERRNTIGLPLAVAVDGSGNVIITGVWYHNSNGESGDCYTAKYAAEDGTLLWEQYYNGPGNSLDSAQAVAVDGDGNVVVTGHSCVSVTNNSYVSFIGDYYTAKYATTDGTLLWEKRYNGSANSDDRANAVAVDGRGNVVVTGRTAVSGSPFAGFVYDYYTTKYAAADGTLLWEKRYNGPANQSDSANALAVDGNGNVVVAGVSHNDSDYYGNSDYYTAKYASADGALLWEKRSSSATNSYNSAQAVAVDSNGNVVVTGTAYFGTTGSDLLYTAKYAAVDGTLLWEKRQNGIGVVDNSRCLALGPRDMIAIAGSSTGYVTVVYREVLSAVSIDLVPTGIRLRFTGESGRNYRIERAPAVNGPWSTLATPIAPGSGLIEYHDMNPPAGQAFYRTAQL